MICAPHVYNCKLACGQFIKKLTKLLTLQGPIFWELKPFTKGHTNVNFEFAIIKTDKFDNVKPNYSAFSKYLFPNGNRNFLQKPVVVFDNQDKSAVLISPVPYKENLDYSNLYTFLKNAPVMQIKTLFQTIAEEIVRSELKTVWVSTSGLGVSWLHIRLDKKPKYYNYEKYKK